MKVMADQQAALFKDLKEVQEKQANTLADMSHKQKAAPKASGSRKNRNEDDMDIDDGDLGDDEEDYIPVTSRGSRPVKLTGPSTPRKRERQDLVVR
ncbi:hypothetical protein BV20DRAFT_903179, partial [Pilatotrama ljubarskyi]